MNVQFDVVISKEKRDEATLILGLVNKAAVPIANVAVAFSQAQGAVALVLTGSHISEEGKLIRGEMEARECWINSSHSVSPVPGVRRPQCAVIFTPTPIKGLFEALRPS